LLVAEERSVLGKKVKKLRREGLLPANVYGKGLSSTALQVKIEDFNAVYKQVGETGLVDLKLKDSSKPVLIKSLQYDYKTQSPLHADFYQVNLKEKVKMMVPIVMIGEPVAVTDKAGILLQALQEVEVEALPESLPENIEANVEHLAAVGEHISVGDLKAPEGVSILTDAGQVVVNIGELTVEEPEPEVEEEAVEEGAEGAETPEGEEATEESKEESKEEAPESEKTE
jgi:large subunit ribosomal protein L25